MGDGQLSLNDGVKDVLLRTDESFRELLPAVFEFFGVPDPERPAARMDPEAKQRQIFVDKLSASGHGIASVRSGRADGTIDSILRFSSIPGYSRHHTAATVDIVTPGFGLASFHRSAAFRWLSADGHANAEE